MNCNVNLLYVFNCTVKNPYYGFLKLPNLGPLPCMVSAKNVL